MLARYRWIAAVLFMLQFAVLAMLFWSDSTALAETKIAYLPVIRSEAVSDPDLDFVATFDRDPPAPLRWSSTDWDITVHSRSIEHRYSLAPMEAGHGPDCSPPPATHLITAYEDTVFLCRNHIMTAINEGGYGLIYLTPNRMIDFSTGEAMVSFDVSTARSSSRDWIDLWITPYDDNLQLPLRDWLPDLSGEPRRAVHIEMDFGGARFGGGIVRDFEVHDLDADMLIDYADYFMPSFKERRTFELRLSRNHVKFGMPDLDIWWIDEFIDMLDWSTGIVQIGHHSYNPTKDCSDCGPNTWHWDNVTISPAVPFTMIHADRRYVDPTTSTTIHLDAPVPSNGHLRFAGIGEDLEISFDDGQTWQETVPQAQEMYDSDKFWSYWTPIPSGTEQVTFRGQSWWGGSWHVRDMTVWSTSMPSKTAER